MKKQQGLTLIEIMIAMMLGLFIITATLAVYINTTRSSSDTIKSVRLNYDLGMTMSLMVNDIKRAGYWGGAVVGSNSLTNPFMVTATTVNTAASAAPNNVAPYNFTPTDVNILNFTDTAGVVHTNGCILYSYDANGDSHYDDTPADTTYTVNDTNEFYGFRVNAGAIQMRTTGTTTADCTDGNWERITDENMINITDLQFSFVAMAAQAATTTAPIHAAYPALVGTSRCIDFTTTGTPNTNNTINCATDANTASATNGVSVVFTPTLANPATTANPAHSIAVKRVVNIRVTGSVVNDSDVQRSLSSTVEIRNNRLYMITATP